MDALLGTFWFNKGSFYGQQDVMDGTSTLTYGDYMQVNADHYEIWDKYSKLMGVPSRLPYDSIPRGRVLFHIPTHRYIVVGSKAIVENEEVKDKCRKYFGLPMTTEFRWDEHYR